LGRDGFDEITTSAQVLTNDPVEESAPATDTDASSDTEPFQRSLRPSGFKLLQAKFVAAQAGTRREGNPRRKADEIDLIARELEHFFEMDIPKEDEEFIDTVMFWKQNASKFPHLIKVALTLCAIPASSGESERLFSDAG